MKIRIYTNIFHKKIKIKRPKIKIKIKRKLPQKGINMKIYLVRHGETDANKNKIMPLKFV